LSRRFPGLLHGHGRRATILRELNVMSTTYRSRLPVVAGCLGMASVSHTLFVTAFYLVTVMLFPVKHPSLGEHFLVVPLSLFSTAVPLPFGALGLSEGVNQELFTLVGHPGGAIALFGFRVLMYGGGLVCAAVYLARLQQVRGLTEAAEELGEDEDEDEPEDEKLSEPEPAPSYSITGDEP
jgi:uncharacterized membrane protein YbhN (UPF0104 family)